MNEIKYKKVWKDPGYCNGEFLPIKPLRGQVLDYWEMSIIYSEIQHSRQSEEECDGLCSV